MSARPLPPAPEAALPSANLTAVSAPTAPGAEPERWSLARRIAFRFAFVYLVLYGTTMPLEKWGLEGVYKAVDAPWKLVVPWVARHVLGLERDLSLGFEMGRMDSAYSYVQVLVFALVAAGVAALWSWVDRARREYTRAHELLRVQVRYVLAAVMLSYGMSKVFPTQFPFPGPERLSAPLGELSSPAGPGGARGPRGG